MNERRAAIVALVMSTFAFTVCFAVWVMNGVLVTFLVDNKVFAFSKSQVGWLLGVPVLTGSLLRLPLGIATDRWGGRVVFPLTMAVAALGPLAIGSVDSYCGFIAASLLFGVAGASFAVGVAYVSLWFGKEKQGTALGVFGVGNLGAGLTALFAPTLLQRVTDGGTHLDGWRTLPRVYAALLVVTAIVFPLVAKTRVVAVENRKTLQQSLAPLRILQVWRFGLYYFLVFGGFVALSQWLIPYYVNVYAATVAFAGMLAAAFSLPAAGTRALGGWLSDKVGARRVSFAVFAACAIGFLLLVVPRMEVNSPGEGVMAAAPGTVTAVDAEHVTVGNRSYALREHVPPPPRTGKVNILPKAQFWQEPVVAVGAQVAKKQLLARGVTNIYFEANLWVFSTLVLLVGVVMGIGMAAVYKFIPQYFPDRVGVVGGTVGMLGGLGGFFLPLVFGYLLSATGIWTTCWLLLAALSLLCLGWLWAAVRRVQRRGPLTPAEQE